MKENKLPKFKSEKEEADFWSTHSPLDYPNEFKEVNMQIKRRKPKHRHEWEKKEIKDKKGYSVLKYIQCKNKTCKKVSVPNKPARYRIRRRRIKYITKGAFGKQS